MKSIFDRQNKGGFTLVEVIVVITILAAAAAVAVPSLLHYQEKAAQMTRDKDAKTVFLAAQNALTTKYTSGKIGNLNAGDGKVEVDNINPKPGDIINEENRENIVYLFMDKNTSNKSDNKLYQLLEPYLTDKDIFDQSLLIEYNKESGKLFSAFYSDEATLRYDSAGGAYNAHLRDRALLASGEVGYCTVDTTGKLPEPSSKDGIDPPDITTPVMLVDYVDKRDKDKKIQQGNDINRGKNYGLLTLECQLPEGGMEDTSQYIIELELDSVLKYRLELTGAQLKGKADLDSAFGNPTKPKVTYSDKNTQKYPNMTGMIPAYIEEQEIEIVKGQETEKVKRNVFVLVLDSVTSGPNAESNAHAKISNTYNLAYKKNSTFLALDQGMLKAKVTVNAGLKEKDPILEEESDTVHSYFANRFDENGTNEIASVRHLNHIRDNIVTDSPVKPVYHQKKDFSIRSYEAGGEDSDQGIIDFEPLWNYRDNSVSKGISELFQGSYDGDGHIIYDLTMTDAVRAFSALFTVVDKDSEINNLSISYTNKYRATAAAAAGKEPGYYVHGRQGAAAIAVYNRGQISHCSVEGNYNATEMNGSAGGITAINPGNIANCFVAANVTAISTAGGIAGKDKESGSAGTKQSQIINCEVGTASRPKIEGDSSSKVIGTPLFGNVNGKTTSYLADCKNDVFLIQSNGGTAGGILGNGEMTSLSSCVNAAKVEAQTGAGGIVGTGGNNLSIVNAYNAGAISDQRNAGGIIGFNSSKIKSCYNTGKIEKGTNVGGIYGTFADNLSGPTPVNCYTLGTVAVPDEQEKNGTVIDENNKEQTIEGMASNAGGLFGYPYPQLTPAAINSTLGNPHRTPWK